MIANYGLLWQRKYVQFGSAGTRGTLQGKRSATGMTVDFREQIGIYVLYDKDMRPVYVGQAGNGNANLFSRLKSHTKDHLWNRWEYFTWFGLRKVNAGSRKLSQHDHADKVFRRDGGGLLNQMEGTLIAAMEPALNKQGAKFTGVDKYLQQVDDDVLELTLEDLMDEMQSLRDEVASLKRDKARSRNVA
ncbi:GIY-YIG nuclease family protein [Lysobacter sp.]|uniref:GIY-YIG nuclease family protein n=1 Tax=Lysobacter sp. TaxID=72226 RepID=UPI002D733D59|nr:GIY-YIG nuclease family protein [Lysobacter sp.]HZX79214.1 GIY-YIG nuclease family protein [Lysobacter sp.]